MEVSKDDSSQGKSAITHYRVCNYCEAMCGVKVNYDPKAELDEDKIKVTPDRDDPFSRGSMCPKASALGALHFDPNRLKKPVKRVNDEWQEISWQEAYDTIESRLKSIRSEFGADSIASYLGNPIVHNLGMMLFVKTLTRAIGSKNVFSATSMDQLPHHFAAHFMFGHEMRIPLPDINRCDFMIIMGANPLASNGSLMTSAGVTRRLRQIQQRNGKFIVIDPRKTETAKIASEHHFIKPGTDAFFLLAFLHIIFREGKAAPGRLKTHINGFDQLPALVLEYTPEKVATVVGIDAVEIERLAAEYLSHDKAVLYGRMGLSTQPHGGLCHWLINTINIITGHFDRPGGMMFSSPAIEAVRDRVQESSFGRWGSRVRNLKEFGGELPVSAMGEEFDTPGGSQIKAFMTVCGNPALSSPNGKRLDEALPELEFMFSIDNFINETTRHAHLILPTPTGLEIDHYDLVFNALAVSNNAKFSEALFPPSDDRPFDWQILKELTRRLSPTGLGLVDRLTTPRRLINLGLMFGAYGKLSSPKRWFDGLSLKKLIASRHGISFGPLKSRIPECLITPDNKIQLAADVFLQRLAEVSQQEWPQLCTPAGIPSTESDFLLIGRRNVSTNNSWMHQVKRLSMSKQVRCTAMIHPDDASRLAIGDGEEIKVVSRVGEIVLPAEITDSMMVGVISIPHGFGHTKKGTRTPHAESKPGVSVNDITDHERIDPLTGNAAFSGQSVSIVKISDHAPQSSISGKPLTVVYGSQSGNAEMIAQDIKKAAATQGLLADIVDMEDMEISKLATVERILVIVSTFGDGDMPDNAAWLWEEINQSSISDFDNCHFAVLGLGDQSYEHFCEAGKQWDKRLAELGATRVSDLVLCDVDYADKADNWVEQVLPLIGATGDQRIVHRENTDAGPVKKIRYNRRNPFLATLREKRQLNKAGSTKQTMHYELSLPGDEVEYSVGDAVYILPQNRIELVDGLLQPLTLDGDDYPQGYDLSLRQLLTGSFELRLPNRNFLKAIAERSQDDFLQELLLQDTKVLEQYLGGKDIIDLLQLHPPGDIDSDELLQLLSPILPRAYSISSSLDKHPGEVHITVAGVQYDDNGRTHYGACSDYLASQLQPGDKLKCYFVANRFFTIPEDGNSAMIMVGPGTGIAPFRGFLEAREVRGDKGDNWLFFGDRNAASDFLYEEELTAMQQSGLLTSLDLAFSRDQEQKIYVQQQLLEKGAELFAWLQRGAYFYICGDATRMAKDVDRALHEIVESQGEMNPQQAIDYVDNLRRERRYVTDVY